MGVEPKIERKPPTWMVKRMENPIKMDDLGGFPTIFGNTQCVDSILVVCLHLEVLPLAALPIWVGVEAKHHRSKAIGVWVIDVA